MKKLKKLLAFSVALMVTLLSITVIYAAMSDGIIEKHNITLSDEHIQVSRSNKISWRDTLIYSNGTNSIKVNNNYEEYDLIAMTEGDSEESGFVLGTGLTSDTYTFTNAQKEIMQYDTYTIMAIRHYDYNRYISSQADLELLNLEHRHIVLNDDLNVGDSLSFYTEKGEYISDLEEYDLINGLYDYHGNEIKSITNRDTCIKLPVNTSTVVDLTSYWANDFYNYDDELYTIANYDVTLGHGEETGLFDRYGSKVPAIRYYYNEKLYYYVFTPDGVYVNGVALASSNAPTTVDLNKATFANGMMFGGAYSSKVFRNIYLLNNIEIDKEIELIMPFHINLLNKTINLNENLIVKNYYKSDIKFSNYEINNIAGELTGSGVVEYTLPNASLVHSDDNASFPQAKFLEVQSDLLDDVLDFVDGYLKLDLNENDINYHLFTNFPILPKNYYDEDVEITYKYKGTDDDFYIAHNTNTQKSEITVSVYNKTTGASKSKDYNIWIKGDGVASKCDTLARKLQYEINDNYRHTNSSKLYVNYELIDLIMGNTTYSFVDYDNVLTNTVYLEVKTPISGNQTSNLYKLVGDDYVLFDNKSSVVDYGNDTYYEKYLEIERLNYTFVDNAIGKFIIREGSNDYYVNVALNKITIDEYIDLIKNEIGTIYFEGTTTTYNLKSIDDLSKYNVGNIEYTPVIYYESEYSPSPALNVDENYVLNNVSASSSSNYYLMVKVTLNSGEEVTFYTNRILFTTSSSGGDGDNEYFSSTFEEDFNKISTFIGLSNEMYLNGNRYFYMEMDDTNIVKLLKKVSYTTWLSKYSSGYYYIDSDNVLHTISSEADIPVGTKSIYTLPALTDSIEDNHVVFLTDNTLLDGVDHKINVVAYITDREFATANELKTVALAASSINLYNGLFDANGNPITMITNGDNTYYLTYNDSNVVTDVTYDGNHLDTATVNIIGYYYNGYVYSTLEIGMRINPENGLYTSKTIKGEEVDEITFGSITLNYTYDEYYEPESITYLVDFSDNRYEYYKTNGTRITENNYNLENGLYDENANPVTEAEIYGAKFTFDYSSGVKVSCRSITVDQTHADIYARSASQQTTFFNSDGTILTVYVQNYSFTVPAIYKPSDLNDTDASVSNRYDLYTYLLDNYAPITDESTNHGFKEINGNNYYLLRSYLENIESLDIDADGKRIDPQRLASLEALKILRITDAELIDDRNGSNTYLDDGLSRLARTALATRLIELSFDNVNIKPALSDNVRAKYLDFSKFTNLITLSITNDNTMNMEEAPKLYRKLENITLSGISGLRKIDNLAEGINLKYIDLRNNNIELFEPLIGLLNIKKLYISGNYSEIYLNMFTSNDYGYGSPQVPYANGTMARGSLNYPTLLTIYDSNTLEDDDFSDKLNNLNSVYKEGLYILNSITYLSKYNNEFYLDLSPLNDKYDISTDDVKVYVSSNDQSYTRILPVASQKYKDHLDNYIVGLFKTSTPTTTSAIIVLDTGGYIITRQIHFTIESYGF